MRKAQRVEATDIYWEYEIPIPKRTNGLSSVFHVSYCFFHKHMTERPCYRDADMLLILLNGCPRFEHVDGSVEAGRGSVTLYRRGEVQAYATEGIFEVIGLLLHLSSPMKRLLTSAGHPHGQTWTDALSDPNLEAVQEFVDNQHLSPEVAQIRNGILCDWVISQCLRIPLSEGLPRRARFSDIAEYIRMNPLTPHRIRELARMAHLSPSRFGALFRQEYGQSIGQFIIDVRMQHAKHLLKQRTYTAAEIALKMGYNSPYAFYAAFKKQTGMSPKNYLQQESR